MSDAGASLRTKLFDGITPVTERTSKSMKHSERLIAPSKIPNRGDTRMSSANPNSYFVLMFQNRLQTVKTHQGSRKRGSRGRECLKRSFQPPKYKYCDTEISRCGTINEDKTYVGNYLEDPVRLNSDDGGDVEEAPSFT